MTMLRLLFQIYFSYVELALLIRAKHTAMEQFEHAEPGFIQIQDTPTLQLALGT